ncbi:hypothetical protein NMY22_g6860 [Coprinellus aureogranulatus]|nr:hypothetical protein NMY22_g6860 [Coprinellus aureogranulatus]
MANPRQRRKLRSGSHRPAISTHSVCSPSYSPLAIKGPKALQEAWDKRKTVKQNYARLGLIHDLNPSAPGGTSAGGTWSHHRDESGNVIGVELPEEEDEEAREEVEETMDDLEPEADESVMDRWAGSLGQRNEVGGEKHTGVLEGELHPYLGRDAFHAWRKEWSCEFASRSPSERSPFLAPVILVAEN